MAIIKGLSISEKNKLEQERLAEEAEAKARKEAEAKGETSYTYTVPETTTQTGVIKGLSIEEKRKKPIPLATSDGKTFGTVSYDAYQALQNDTLDSYAPKNKDEKIAIDKYKNYIYTTPFETSIGGDIIKLSKKRMDEISNSVKMDINRGTDKFRPADNNEKLFADFYAFNIYPTEGTEKEDKTWAKSLWDNTLGSIGKGIEYSNLSIEAAKLADATSTPTKQQDRELLKREKQINERYGIEDNWMTGVGQQIGQYIAMLSMPESAPIVSSLGAAGAATGAAAGAPALGVGALPGAAAGAVVGLGLGIQTAFGLGIKRLETGSNYIDNIKSGLDHKTSAVTAQSVGAINGIVEFMQWGLVSKGFKAATSAGKKIIKNVAGEAGEKLTQKVLKNAVAKGVIKTAATNLTHTLKESGEEIVQEGVSIAGTNIAKAINGKPLDSFDDIQKRIIDTGISSFITFGLMGAPSSIIGTRATIGEAKRLNDYINKLNDAAMLLPPDVRPESLGYNATVDKVQKQYDTIEKLFSAPEVQERLQAANNIVAQTNAISQAKSDLADFNKEIAAIQADTTLSDEEKQAQIQGYQTQSYVMQDYIMDLSESIQELTAIKDNTASEDIINKYNNMKPFETFTELAPTHIDGAVGVSGGMGLVRVEKAGNKYKVTTIGGRVTLKDSIVDRYIDINEVKSVSDALQSQYAKESEGAQFDRKAPVTEENLTEEDELLSTPLPSTPAEKLDVALVKLDISDTERYNILATLNKFEQGAKASGINLDVTIDTVHKFNTAIRNELQGKFGRVKAEIDGNTYSLVMELLLDPNTPITDNFINGFANVWVDLWEKSNSVSYNSVIKYLKDNDMYYSKEHIAQMLTEYSIAKTIDGDATNIEVVSKSMFGKMVNEFKQWLSNVVKNIAQLKNVIWKGAGRDFQVQARAFAAGDWSVVLETQEAVEAVEETAPIGEAPQYMEQEDIAETPAEKAPVEIEKPVIEEKAIEKPTETIDDIEPPEVEQDVQADETSETIEENLLEPDVELEEGQIITLTKPKRKKGFSINNKVYNLFKRADKLYIGKDYVTDGFIAISKTDGVLADIEKIGALNVYKKDNTLSDLFRVENAVLLTGDPKLYGPEEAKRFNKKPLKNNSYIFKISNTLYQFQQEFLDAFNDGNNKFYVNRENPNFPTGVMEGNKLVGVIVNMRPADIGDKWDSLKNTSAQIKEYKKERQKKIEATKSLPVSNKTTRLFISDSRILYFNMGNDELLISNGKIILKADKPALDYIVEKNNEKNSAWRSAIEAEEAPKLREYIDNHGASYRFTNNPILSENKFYIFTDGNKYFAYDKKYVDVLNKNGNRFFVNNDTSNIREHLLVVKNTSDEVEGVVLPINLRSDSKEYFKNTPTIEGKFYTEAKKTQPRPANVTEEKPKAQPPKVAKPVETVKPGSEDAPDVAPQEAVEQVKPLEENVDVMEPTKPGTKDTREKDEVSKQTETKSETEGGTDDGSETTVLEEQSNGHPDRNVPEELQEDEERGEIGGEYNDSGEVSAGGISETTGIVNEIEDATEGLGDGEPDAGASINDNIDEPMGSEGSSGTEVKRAPVLNKDNYVLDSDIDNIKPNARDNIEAIKTLQTIERENRQATADEKKILAKYKGWGGLKDAFTSHSYVDRELRSLLSPVEYKSARATILNAHFTSTKVIEGMYSMLKRLGYNGGNLLEPSMGTGNFFGTMPKNISSKTNLYGVEFDSLTGRIAKMLYPDAQIEISPFQDVNYKDDSFDVAIGNVPFSEITYKYRGEKYTLHDYFFIKTLDKVKSGGIVMFLTSTGTLDKFNQKARISISEKANLVAAFRLPNNAFKINAGTEVTTDLLIFQKRPNGVPQNSETFLDVGKLNDIPINEYYVRNPKNILGELTYEKGMYAQERTQVRPPDGDFQRLFNKAVKSLPIDIINADFAPTQVDENVSGEARPHFYVKNNKVVFEKGGITTEYTGIPARRITHYIKIRDKYNELLKATVEEKSDAEKDRLRKELGNIYDAFKNDRGLFGKNKTGNALNDFSNVRLFEDDFNFWKVSGLEILNSETNNYEKSQIFVKDTISYKKPTTANDSYDALIISLNETGKIDFDRMSNLTGFNKEKLINDLPEYIIEAPEGDFQILSVYLSGNVRQKYLDAKKAAEKNSKYQNNVNLLEKVLPKDKAPSEITPMLGASWIDVKYVSEFAKEIFGSSDTPLVSYDKTTSTWFVDRVYGSTHNMYSKYGTSRVNASEIITQSLNLKTVSVYDRDSMGHSYINAKETALARQKQTEIKEAFKEWAFKDKDRRDALVAKYNELFNNNRNMDYMEIAKYIRFPDLDTSWKMRDYQKAAVARIIFGGDTLLAHGVGTGKTAEMIAAAMELKRMGITNKNMMAVPKNKIGDFRTDILKMYPAAKILMATEKDFNTKNRAKLFAKIASNDWDIVIVGHSSFGLMPVSKNTLSAYVEAQIQELEEVITSAKAETGRQDKRFIRQLEKSLQNSRERLNELLDSKKDDTITFEEMGVDGLFVDEAHNFKNLNFYTKLNVPGIKGSSSKRAEDMFMKTQYVRNKKGIIVFATATPITNTVSEMYNMTRFVNPDLLKNAGIYSFDGWASNFGSIETKIEVSPDGRSFRTKERFAKYVNVPEMVAVFRQFADIKKTSDVIKDLPKANRIDVVSPALEVHDKYIDSIASRIQSISGSGQKKTDNMLLITIDGRCMATDLRLVRDQIEKLGLDIQDLDVPESRVNNAVSNIVKEYKDSDSIKGTQLVFLDYGVSAKEGGRYNFGLYGDIINKLTENGIPRNEIAVIGDYNTVKAKEKLFKDVNSGKIRVLIGSTAKMGEGMNAQERAVALHHLNPPHRPADIEQREGRIIRYGNINESVNIYRYIQEKSFDSYLWQALARKAEFIDQAMSGGNVTEMDEIDDFVLSAKEGMALATGNPLIIKKVEIDEEVKRLQMLQKSHNASIFEMQDNIAKAPSQIDSTKKRIAGIEADIKASKANEKPTTDDFRMTIKGKTYTKKADATVALKKAMEYSAGKHRTIQDIGEFRGFKMVYMQDLSNGSKVYLRNNQEYEVLVSNAEGANNIQRIINQISLLPKMLEHTKDYLQRLTKDYEVMLTDVEKPFKYKSELENALQDQAEIDAQLNIGGNDVSSIITEEMDDKFEEDAEEEDASQEDVSYLLNEGVETDEQEERRRSISTSENMGREAGKDSSIGFGTVERGAGGAKEISAGGETTYASRRIYTQNVKANGQTEKVTLYGISLEKINPEAHNAEMQGIADSNKSLGVETVFYTGIAQSSKSSEIRGFIVRKNTAYVQYDNSEYSPEQINKHEIAHSQDKTTAYIAIKKKISDSMSYAKRIYIIKELYSNYYKAFKGNEDKVFDEFICDILSGVDDHSIQFKDDVTKFWEIMGMSVYNAGTYSESIDAGGEITDEIVVEDNLSYQDEGIKFSLRKSPPPEKTIKAYKFFGVKAKEPGLLFPAYVQGDAIKPGQWYDAEVGEMTTVNGKPRVVSKGALGQLGTLAPRPGFHAGEIPSSPQNRSGGRTAAEKIYENDAQVWAEVELSADKSYQKEAEADKAAGVADGLGGLPTNGYYEWNTSSFSKGQWYISGAMKVNRVLTDSEVRSILEANGYKQGDKFPTKADIDAGRSEPSPLNHGRSVFATKKGGDIDLSKYGLDTKYSLKDSTGRELTPEQAEFFKDSKVRDADGNLLVVYHGTSEDFTVFNQTNDGKFGKGIYFTNIKNMAEMYGNNAVSAYANIKSPFSPTPKQWREFSSKNRSDLWQSTLIKKGYDGIIIKGTGDYLEIVAFSPEQIKSVDNLKPTSDPDIRYSFKSSDVNDIGLGEDGFSYNAGDKVDDNIRYNLTNENMSEMERAAEVLDIIKSDRLTKTKKDTGSMRENISQLTRTLKYIPERGERGTFFAEARRMFLLWKNADKLSQDKVLQTMQDYTKNLSPAEFATFEQLVYLQDLQEEAKIQSEKGNEMVLLPNEFTPEDIEITLKSLESKRTANVEAALKTRQEMFKKVSKEYAGNNAMLGFDTENRFKRDNYFHHQVIDYVNDMAGKGKRSMQINQSRGWLKARDGSTLPINSNVLMADYEVLQQMQLDNYKATLLHQFENLYDIKPDLEKEAFSMNKKLLNAMIGKEAGGRTIMKNGRLVPDSEIYNQQQKFNQLIMMGFSNLFGLAEAGQLDDLGVYKSVVNDLAKGNLKNKMLYKYISELVNSEFDESNSQAVISAKTVLKYTAQKKAWVKEVLGNKYQTWESLAKNKEGYSIIQPRKGNYFYNKEVIDAEIIDDAVAKLLDKLLTGTANDTGSIRTEYAKIIRLQGASFRQWVVPNEIVDQMNEATKGSQFGKLFKVISVPTNIWKGVVTTLHPEKTIKFGMRNLVGDLDAVVAGDPGVIKYTGRAFKELRTAMGKNPVLTPDMQTWKDRGGFQALILANELDDKAQKEIFAWLDEKGNTRLWEKLYAFAVKYPEKIREIHNFREALLRYAAYLYYKNKLTASGGVVKDYVASNRDIINGLHDINDKAYQLSDDLLGAYDQISVAGQWIRAGLVPFFSFTETNFKRYYRLLENAMLSDDIHNMAPSERVKKLGRVGAVVFKRTGTKGFSLWLRINLIGILMELWNSIFFPDEEEALPEAVQARPHIVLGKSGDRIFTFDRLGSFAELLEWFSMDNTIGDLQDISDGKVDTAKLIGEIPENMFDKAINMISPFIKMPIELSMGVSFYPSTVHPRPIRDKIEYFMQSWGLSNIYNYAMKKPHYALSENLINSVVYGRDIKESAFNDIYAYKNRYKGIDDTVNYQPTAKSNAIYYMKKAIRQDQKDVAVHQMNKYFEAGGTAKDVKGSFSRLNPLYGLGKKQGEKSLSQSIKTSISVKYGVDEDEVTERLYEFVETLDEYEKAKFKMAIKYYKQDIAIDEDTLELLKKKDITEQEAKNLLKKYINRKTK